MYNTFAEEWAFKERHGLRPTRVRQIVRTPYVKIAQMINEGLPSFVRYMVDSLYAGDVYILQGAFDPLFMENLRDKTFAYFQSKPSEFYKMLEGSPDFHRLIDLETGKKYAFNVCKHSAFFYPWNDDPLGIFPEVYERWRVIKRLMGLEDKAYEKNTPKDGVVDRIQVAQYPNRIGFLEPHSDPYLHQRLFFSGYMSTRGHDYHGGGFYLVGQGDRVIAAENDIEAGDVGIGYATVYHGVAPCNRDREPEWDMPSGRWFLSMYSNASDEVENRHTGHPVKLNIPEVIP
jgi:hypothetical protein